MDIRYSANQRDVRRYTTEELRSEFLIDNLYVPDEVVAVYSHVDRMVTLGCMPVRETLPIDKGIDVWASFGTEFFLERREIGIFNIGGAGVIEADGQRFTMGCKDCLYITMGTRNVTFSSEDDANPAKYFMVSAPAHCAYQTTFIGIADAAKKPLGSRQQESDKPVYSPGCTENLPAFHGSDDSGAGQCVEYHAGAYPRAPHGDLHLYRCSGGQCGVPFYGHPYGNPASGDAERAGGHQPQLEYPFRLRNLQLFLHLGDGRRESGL